MRVGASDLRDDRAGVEARIHLHDGDAGFFVAGKDGPLDGRGPTPARQKGGVDIQRPKRCNVEDALRQDQAIGSHNERLRGSRLQALERPRIAQGLRLEYLQALP